MQEKSCRCGASKKRFRMDIGPFYVAECCKEAGYDDLGRSQDELKQLQDDAIKEAIHPQPSSAVASVVDVVMSVFKPGRGKLMDMKIDELKAIANGKGIEGIEQMTKKQLVAVILQ